MKLRPLTTTGLAALPGIRHGFFTRHGGVSGGIYASLNCGPGSRDDQAAVRENRRRVAAALGLAEGRLVSLYQVHGRRVVRVEAPFAERPQADGMVTRMPGLALGILAADCVPVLFADDDTGVIGACHAGWKGALAGITDATVAEMVACGARSASIRAAIGPCIRQPSYEVGPEFPAPFLAEDAGNARFFRPSPRPGHHLFDLAGYVATRLGRLGLGLIEDCGHDTRAAPELFFSYRRTTLAGEPDYGRQISAIALGPR
ncbi:MAG: peptidoglycan editing factor PgeF [Alphaproteobacteria bacterium]|nr:peptidoglycan editing factor PgeF [Alphaproteobacteria bacterium]